MPKELTRVDPAELIEQLTNPLAGDDETGVRILAVAGQIIARSGVETLEVDVVARRSGVGRSTIYRRFGDRNGLIVAALGFEGQRLLTALAGAVAHVDDLVEEVVMAFCAGLRVVRAQGLPELLRSDDLLLRLLTIDGHVVVAAARDHLAGLARRRDPSIPPEDAARVAELLVRLAISFVLVPETALDDDGDISEDTVRRHVAPLLRR